MRNRLKLLIKIITLIAFSFCLIVPFFAQEQNVQKGSILVPKFALKWSDFESNWSGFLKAELHVEQTIARDLTINGIERWEEVPVFPSFDHSKEGFKSLTYKMEYSRPSIVSYKIDSIDRKKGYTEIKLSKLDDRIVDVKVRMGESVGDLQKAIQKLFFIGNLEEFSKSDYFMDRVMPKIIKGTKSENIDKEDRLRLMKGIDNNVNSLKVFKQRLYFGIEFKDKREFNSNLVNEVERAARTIRQYLPELKKALKIAASLNEFDGVKLETTLRHRNFAAKGLLGNSLPDFDSFEFYVPVDALKLFAESEITDQDLVDQSFVLLNGNRIRVNLSQFSN